jgi:hypothetical protein
VPESGAESISKLNVMRPLANISSTLRSLAAKCSSINASAVRARYAEVLRNFIASAVFLYPGLGVYLLWIVGVGLPSLRLFLLRSREVPHSHF